MNYFLGGKGSYIDESGRRWDIEGKDWSSKPMLNLF